MSYITVPNIKQSYQPTAVAYGGEGNLIVVPAPQILSGQECAGGMVGLFDDASGVQVRNKLGRTTFYFKNAHEFLNAYVRIRTTKVIQTLQLEDIIFELPPDGNLYAVAGFTNIFQIKATVEEHPIPDVTVNREYSDFIQINFTHDSESPLIYFGAAYV